MRRAHVYGEDLHACLAALCVVGGTAGTLLTDRRPPAVAGEERPMRRQHADGVQGSELQTGSQELEREFPGSGSYLERCRRDELSGGVFPAVASLFRLFAARAQLPSERLPLWRQFTGESWRNPVRKGRLQSIPQDSIPCCKVVDVSWAAVAQDINGQ